MKYFVIIRGPAGVGKSVIGRLLAKKIKAKVIHFDKIMTGKLDYVPGEKWIPLYKFLKADKILVPKLKKIIKRQNIVLDGNFYHKKHIKDLINKIKTHYFIFTIKASLKECVKRDESRKNKLGEQATKDIFKLVSVFDYGIIINTNKKTPVQIVKEITAKLPK